MINREKCTGCAACYNICPFKAIKMEYDNEGFLYPEINELICRKCGLCEKVCPKVNSCDVSAPVKSLFAKYKNDNIRMKSTSGGVFTALAEDVLNKHGIVYGAAFNENFTVYHRNISKIQNIDELRGSKYIQSEIGHTFYEIKKYLDNNIWVLFTGTPCQCSGLKNYLKKEYSNLIVCDLVCYGVPSPKIFKEFINYIEKKYHSKVKKYIFRDKEIGWSTGKSKIILLNGKDIKNPYVLHTFDELYWSNLILRPSCYNCKYHSLDRPGDITIGDFWGIDLVDNTLNDEKGISLVFLNTSKGINMFHSIEEKLSYGFVTLEDCISKQERLKFSVYIDEKARNDFWQLYYNKGFEYIVDKYTHNNKYAILKFFIKNNIKKLLRVGIMLKCFL